jgi:hypothetical protein
MTRVALPVEKESGSRCPETTGFGFGFGFGAGALTRCGVAVCDVGGAAALVGVTTRGAAARDRVGATAWVVGAGLGCVVRAALEVGAAVEGAALLDADVGGR